MRFYPTAALATIVFAALIEPSFAGALTVPGPVAGIGLPALAVVGGIYWVGRKLLKPNE